MSRKIIKVVPINNLKGIIIDSKKWHGRKIYRAFAKQKGIFSDPLYTYLKYEDGKYTGLQDEEDEEELPEELQVNYDYYDQEPEMEDVPRSIVQRIIEEQIENFKWLNRKLEKKLDIKQVIKWINSIPIKTFKEEVATQDEGYRSLRGYFDPRRFYCI